MPLLALFGWLVVLVIHAMWGRRLFWWEGALCTVLRNDSWPVNDEKKFGGWYLLEKTYSDGSKHKKPWNGTALFPYAIMLSENGMNTFTLHHEMRHVRQSVQRGFTFGLLGLFVGLATIGTGLWWLGLLIWLICPSSLLVTKLSIVLESVTNMVGEHRGRAYYDNIMEQHARGAKSEVRFGKIDDILDGKTSKTDIYTNPSTW